jgi:hypothetical protein
VKLRSYYGELFGWEFQIGDATTEAVSQPGDYGFIDGTTTGGVRPSLTQICTSAPLRHASSARATGSASPPGRGTARSLPSGAKPSDECVEHDVDFASRRARIG